MIKRVLFVALAATFVPPAARADDNAANGDAMSRIWGEARVRYEALDGQFRAGGSGGDQIVLFRTLLGAETTFGGVTLGGELQDSRAYLDDAGTPLSTGLINPLDVLQAYARFSTPGLLGASSDGALTIGRQTISIESKRQIERVEFANVIRHYTGAYWGSSNARGDALHLVLAVPVAERPADREGLADNTLSGDEEQWGRLIWGAHYKRADAVPALAADVAIEGFVYGLDERDTSETPTPNRAYVTPGARVYREPKVARWDVDVEAAARFGSRRATSAATDVTDLEVRAGMLFAAAGYTFDAPWRPRLSAQYYWASGDDDPNDGDFDQYERLFGSRRTDLNNTSLHGPLTPANLSAPGARFEIAPTERFDARITYSAAHLASETDAWVIARRRDPTGASGDFIGHAIDARARYWIAPETLRLEVGGSHLAFGRFAETAPGASGADATNFGYVQLTASF